MGCVVGICCVWLLGEPFLSAPSSYKNRRIVPGITALDSPKAEVLHSTYLGLMEYMILWIALGKLGFCYPGEGPFLSP